MTFKIEKAAVIGSGTMGGGIAALLAGIGVETLLLDIPAKGTQAGDSPAKRNAIVSNNLKTLQKMRPAQLFSDSDLALLSIGNTEDDLDKLADCDWVVEVIVENLAIKQSLMEKVAKAVGPDTIISSNTSGLLITGIAENMPADFKRRFLGTHFFNPPRYLHLLEIIPHPETDPAIVDFMMDFGKRALGKGVVLCKGTPNFIGNRFMSMSGSQTMNYALDHGYTVEEVDALTGPLIGRPKTATFNLNDLVGYDIAVHVARNLYPAIPDDPAREVLNHPKANALSDTMLKNNWLGRKTDQGFYWMKKEGGKKELWALNLDTMEYEAPKKVEFESVNQYQRVKPLGERIRLLMQADDRAGEFLFHLHAFYLAYASNRVPEITDNILNIDNAQKWGFAHAMGPFEIWDAIGVEENISKFEEAGYPVADWVKKMVAKGIPTFYHQDEKGKRVAYYDVATQAYVPIVKDPREITIADLKASGFELEANDEASLYDMGDAVLLWEFHSKQNTIGTGLIDMGWKALDYLAQPEWKALVVGNDGERFSIGANLMSAMSAGGPEGIENMIRELQDLTMALKYAPKPVITAPFNMALGGGAELMMAGHKTVAHIELYTGLVELGVGLVPAGGGCKELVRRLVNPIALAGAYVMPGMEKAFTAIATAKVSESAKQAVENGFLSHTDVIVMNRDLLLGEAKAVALATAETYVQTRPEKIYAAGEEVYTSLLLAVEQFLEGRYASEYDAFLARKVAEILTGGGLTEGQWVESQLILDLERKTFLELMLQEKTQERVMYMLQNNKPLRN